MDKHPAEARRRHLTTFVSAYSTVSCDSSFFLSLPNHSWTRWQKCSGNLQDVSMAASMDVCQESWCTHLSVSALCIPVLWQKMCTPKVYIGYRGITNFKGNEGFLRVLCLRSHWQDNRSVMRFHFCELLFQRYHQTPSKWRANTWSRHSKSRVQLTCRRPASWPKSGKLVWVWLSCVSPDWLCEVPLGQSTMWWCSIWQLDWNIPCPPVARPPLWTAWLVEDKEDKEDLMNKEELMTLPTPQGTSHCSCLEHWFLFLQATPNSHMLIGLKQENSTGTSFWLLFFFLVSEIVFVLRSQMTNAFMAVRLTLAVLATSPSFWCLTLILSRLEAIFPIISSVSSINYTRQEGKLPETQIRVKPACFIRKERIGEKQMQLVAEDGTRALEFPPALQAPKHSG